MKKAFLVKLLSLITVLCAAICAFTACSTHVHDFSYTTLTTVTCDKEGSEFGVCSCGATKTIVIPKLEHDFVNGICSSCGVSEGDNGGDSENQSCAHSWQEADCLTPKTCSKCGAVEGLALDHSWGEWFETEPATCQMEGEKRRNCERCGYYETRMILIIDHNFVEGYCSMCGAIDENYHAHSWQEADCLTPKTCLECGAVEGEALGHTEAIDNAVAPDCVNSGLTEGKHCSVCEEVLVGQEVVPTLDHNFVDNACTSCGLQATAAEYFNFELLEDGTYSISAKDVDNIPAEVVIPSSYNGKAVTIIGSQAFYNCSSLTSVVIPDSVTSIGYFAFSNCDSLTSVKIPDSVTTIVDRAFRDCDSLTSVVISDSVTSIDYGVFMYCDSLTSVVIPNGVTSIGADAFYNCSSLTSVVIPNGVTSIGMFAFAWCESLTSVVIPDSVTSIRDSAFAWCESLTSVVIPDSVTSIGDWAFEGCSSLTSIVIPDSVTSIGSHAFEGCSSLTSIVIGDSVTSIGYQAFYGCSSLISVIIPDSVISIGDWAFEGCSSLTSIKYHGSKEEWNAISKGYDWDYYTGNYIITYNYIGE